jgi:hypothetical protein
VVNTQPREAATLDDGISALSGIELTEPDRADCVTACIGKARGRCGVDAAESSGPWKGVCRYHDISVDDSIHHDAAWSYPDPYPASFDRVGKNYSGYVAFDKQQVTVTV